MFRVRRYRNAQLTQGLRFRNNRARPEPEAIPPIIVRDFERESHAEITDFPDDIKAYLDANLPVGAYEYGQLAMSSGNADQQSAPIYSFKLGPDPDISSSPAIYLQGALHGSEQASAIGLMTFCKRVGDPASASANQAAYQAIQDNLTLCVIPFANPAGFQPSPQWPSGTRKVPNYSGPPYYPHLGTDGNRNWPAADNWENYPAHDPSHYTYKGTAPASSVEVQTAMAYFQDNNCWGGIDCHTFPESNQGKDGYGVDVNGAGTLVHWNSWGIRRMSEADTLFSEYVRNPYNTGNQPMSSAWFGDQTAPDGFPAFGQIIEAGMTTGDGAATWEEARTVEAEIIATCLLILVSAMLERAVQGLIV